MGIKEEINRMISKWEQVQLVVINYSKYKVSSVQAGQSGEQTKTIRRKSMENGWNVTAEEMVLEYLTDLEEVIRKTKKTLKIHKIGNEKIQRHTY